MCVCNLNNISSLSSLLFSSFVCTEFDCLASSLLSHDLFSSLSGSKIITTTIYVFYIIGEARRMLRDALTDPARRNERRSPLLSDRGERQGLRYILRHSDCQRYAQHACHHHWAVSSALHSEVFRDALCFDVSRSFSFHIILYNIMFVCVCVCMHVCTQTNTFVLYM